MTKNSLSILIEEFNAEAINKINSKLKGMDYFKD